MSIPKTIKQTSWIVEIQKVKINEGTFWFVVAIPEPGTSGNLNPEIRMKTTNVAQGELLWKRFASTNNIPRKKWIFMDDLIKKKKKEKEDINAKFK